jgi:hypothetical protein
MVGMTPPVYEALPKGIERRSYRVTFTSFIPPPFPGGGGGDDFPPTIFPGELAYNRPESPNYLLQKDTPGGVKPKTRVP